MKIKNIGLLALVLITGNTKASWFNGVANWTNKHPEAAFIITAVATYLVWDACSSQSEISFTDINNEKNEQIGEPLDIDALNKAGDRRVARQKKAENDKKKLADYDDLRAKVESLMSSNESLNAQIWPMLLEIDRLVDTVESQNLQGAELQAAYQKYRRYYERVHQLLPEQDLSPIDELNTAYYTDED